MKRRKASKKQTRQRNNYKLILQEEGTFAEKWALRIRPGQLKWLAAGVIVGIIGCTYALVALTPLREWVVPGYLSTETRQMQVEAWHRTDSLSRALDIQQRYLDNMVAVLEGRITPQELIDSIPSDPSPGPDAPSPEESPSLDRLRFEVAAEDAFSIGQSIGLEDAGLWLSPVDGRVSGPWDPSLGHWGVDLVAPANSPVKSVGRGTVVFAGFTAGGGHTVIVQHKGNRLTTYMHNSRIEVLPGTRVEAGDVIAIIGNSGDHSTGPHLHFEWWESGVPIDPSLRISLGS